MKKRLIPLIALLFSLTAAESQITLLKLVGKDTKDYKIGFGVFLKTAIPYNEGSDITIEGGVNFFFLNYGSGAYGTVMCPLKVGYRYTLNGTGEGLYLEPQVGYNLFGVTSMIDKEGYPIDLKYHGVVFAAGGGYLFSLWNQPFDLNLRYETVIAHGGSNNLIALGISRIINFRKKE